MVDIRATLRMINCTFHSHIYLEMGEGNLKMPRIRFLHVFLRFPPPQRNSLNKNCSEQNVTYFTLSGVLRAVPLLRLEARLNIYIFGRI